MKVLLTGANGFLGIYLAPKLNQKGYTVIATGRGERTSAIDPTLEYVPMDFTDPFAVHDVFERYSPDVVIHAGAMSKVDACELDQWEAYRANVEGTITLMINAAEYRSFFIFVSTDFIFKGDIGMYTEEDKADPVNFYGKTKKEAEEAIMEYEYDWAIARTILVYGDPGTAKDNLVTVVKKKLEKGEEYKVVNDQQRTPTYVEDLADGIISIIERKATGIYHLGGPDLLTPYEMACAVAEHLGLDSSLIKAVNKDSFTQPAQRPLKTGLSIDKAKKKLGYDPVSFNEGLQRTFKDQK